MENSIIHGTELKVGTGHLTIRLQRTQKRLLISVSDDGVGMEETVLEQLNNRLGKGGIVNSQPKEENQGGVALVNVDNRIRLLFGEEYGLHVYSMVGLGTTRFSTLLMVYRKKVANASVISATLSSLASMASLRILSKVL
mgnify:CR=1 FL=1